MNLIAFLITVAAALNNQRLAVFPDAVVRWNVETRCEGFKAGDCSVRSPQTVYVSVAFIDKTVPFTVRCLNADCVPVRTDECDEIAVWVEMARRRWR